MSKISDFVKILDKCIDKKDKASKRILVQYKNGKEIKTYATVVEASKVTGFDYRSLGQHIQGNIKHIKGYTFEWKDI